MQSGTVFWLTGLSGSGKTTIGRELTNTLKKHGYPVIFLDGDELREMTGNVFGYTREQRLQASLMYARLCNMLAAQSFHVVCATISLFHQTQCWNRENNQNYIEIFVDVVLSELIKNDPKKNYSRALKGELSNIVGMDIIPEFPEHPDIIISNQTISVAYAVNEIFQYFKQFQINNHNEKLHYDGIDSINNN